jgi:hypothetical protein
MKNLDEDYTFRHVGGQKVVPRPSATTLYLAKGKKELYGDLYGKSHV